MANILGNNGPRVGASRGRQRNTLVNLAGKKSNTSLPGGFVPPVSAGTALGLGSQTAAAQYGYLAQLAALRQQKAAILAQFRQQRAGIKSALPAAVAHAANLAAERGITGSSIDMGSRAAAHAQAAAALAAARQQRILGLQGVQAARLGASADYYTSLANIEAQRRAEQLQLALAGFENDMYDAAQANYGAIYRQLLQELRDQRSGRKPRKRRGLEPTVLPNISYTPITESGYDNFVLPNISYTPITESGY